MSKAARAAQEAAQDQDTENTEEESTSTETTTTTETTEGQQGKAEGAGDQAAEGQQGQQAAAVGQGGYDVVEEGADPKDKPDGVMPLTTYRKKVSKWQRKIEKARGDAASKDAELELVRLENEQLKQRLAANEKKPRPKRSDFESEEAFEAAEDKWLDERVDAKLQRRAVPATATAAQQQTDDDPESDPQLRAHYERADKLQAPDFEQREDEVIAVLGKHNVRKLIVSKYPNSEAVIYALGGNPKKLRALAEAAKTDPVQAVMDLNDYARSLKLKPRTPAPDPDTNENGSAGAITDAQKQYESLHARWRSGSLPYAQLQAFKSECRKKGINLNLIT